MAVDRVREEAEKLAAAAMTVLSLATRGLGGSSSAFATGSAEDQINQSNFDEATRIMDLLAKADPSNYTLTILRSKLEAKKRQNERELAQQAQREAAATAAAAAPAGASRACHSAASSQRSAANHMLARWCSAVTASASAVSCSRARSASRNWGW